MGRAGQGRQHRVPVEGNKGRGGEGRGEQGRAGKGREGFCLHSHSSAHRTEEKAEQNETTQNRSLELGRPPQNIKQSPVACHMSHRVPCY